jgi:hypothetical protein
MTDNNIVDFHAEHARRKQKRKFANEPKYCPKCVAREALDHVSAVADAIDRAAICNAVPTIAQLREWLSVLHIAETEIAAAERWTLAKVTKG